MNAPAIGKGLISYSYVGAAARVVDQFNSEGTLVIRDDLRQPDGLLAAPVGIMTLMAGSVITHIHAAGAPTRVDVSIFEPAADVTALRCLGRIVRAGRSQVFTESRFVDAADPNRVVAFGTTNYIVTGPGDSSYSHADETYDEPVKPWPALPDVFGGVERADGGYDVPVFIDAISAGGRLHSGATQVLAEAAALNAVRKRTGQRVRTVHMTTSVTSPGMKGPFTMIPEVLSVADGLAACRVEVVDVGADQRVIAVLSIVLRVSD
jgi:acyl-coenzyme A thioesterase PaaI-like protein